MAESEQFYAGLKLNKVESMLVRIPGASHGIAAKPSNLIAKVNAITAWFDKYRKQNYFNFTAVPQARSSDAPAIITDV